MQYTNRLYKPVTALLMTLLLIVLRLVSPSGAALASANETNVWLEPSLLSGDNAEAYPPQIAMNEQGNGIAVWSQYKTTDFSYGIWVAQYSKTKGWSAPKRISNTVGQTGNPRVAINDRGDAIVVWSVFNSDAVPLSTVWSNYYDHRRGWGMPVKIQNDSVDAYFPLVVMDQQGNAIAIWNQNNPAYDKTNIYANYFNHARGWMRSEMIQSSDTLLSLDSALSINHKGEVVAMWEQFDSNLDRAQSGLVTDIFVRGKGWQSPEFITHDDTGSPSIALNERGDILAVWTAMNPSTLQDTVRASWYQASQGWSDSLPIQSNPYIDSDNVQVALGEHDNALVIWRGREYSDFGDSPIYTYSNTYTTASGWATEEAVDEAAPYSAPQLAMDERGNAIAVWETLAPGPNPYSYYHDVYAYHYSPSYGWGNKQILENYTGDSTNPKIAISEDGDALAIWQQTDNISNPTTVWSSRFTSP